MSTTGRRPRRCSLKSSSFVAVMRDPGQLGARCNVATLMKRLRGGGGGAQVIGADLANVSEDPEEFVRQYGNMSIDLEKKVPPPPRQRLLRLRQAVLQARPHSRTPVPILALLHDGFVDRLAIKMAIRDRPLSPPTLLGAEQGAHAQGRPTASCGGGVEGLRARPDREQRGEVRERGAPLQRRQRRQDEERCRPPISAPPPPPPPCGFLTPLSCRMRSALQQLHNGDAARSLGIQCVSDEHSLRSLQLS